MKDSVATEIKFPDLVTPMAEVTRMVSDMKETVSASAQQSTTGVNAQAIATAMAAEFRSVMAELLQQPQGTDSGTLVAAIQEMVREQRTTNTINTRMLRVAQN